MAEPSVTTLFGNLLSPQEMRQFTEAKDLQKGKMLVDAPAGRAGLLYAPQAVTAAGRLGRQLAGGDPRTPEEIQAAENQKLFSGIMQKAQARFPTDRAAQLNYLADELTKAGKLNQANKARAEAQAAQLQQAKIGAESALGFQRQRAGMLSGEQALTEQALRDPRVQSEIAQREQREAAATASIAQSEKYTEEAARTKMLAPLEAITERKKAKAQEAGIKLDTERAKLVNAQITTEEVKQRAEEKGISEIEARTELVEAELDRYIAMTPGEILQQAADLRETEAKTKESQAKRDLAIARVTELSQTDFLRELERSGLSEDEQQSIIEDRVRSLSSPEGLTGAQSQVVEAKIKVVTDAMEEARGASASMAKIERAIPLINVANVGAYGQPLAYVNKVMGDIFGVDSAQSATVANELLAVLGNEITLDAAENLKGALSERDLQFLVNASPTVAKSPASLAILFQDLYKQRYAEQFVARELERQISDLSDTQLREFQAGKAYDDLFEIGKYRAQQYLAQKFNGGQ